MQNSNLIGAVFLGIFALSILVDRITSLNLFYFGAILFWAVAALMLLKRPRRFGLPIAILVFGLVALHLHRTRTGLAEYIAKTDIQVSPKLWVKYWISMMPLILGGIFAVISFWIPARRIGSPNKEN